MKKYATEWKWALIFAAMMLTWMVLERLFGFHDEHIDKHSIVTNFVAIPAIAIYIFALLDKRKNFYRGKMTYQQGLICGLIITLIYTPFSPLIQLITSLAITPDYFANAIRYSVESGQLTQQAAEEFFNLKNYLIQATIGAPIMGTVTTLIVAIFTRKS